MDCLWNVARLVIGAAENLAVETQAAGVATVDRNLRDAVAAKIEPYAPRLPRHRRLVGGSQENLPHARAPAKLSRLGQVARDLLIVEPRERSREVDQSRVDAGREALAGGIDERRSAGLAAGESIERAIGVGRESEGERDIATAEDAEAMTNERRTDSADANRVIEPRAER